MQSKSTGAAVVSIEYDGHAITLRAGSRDVARFSVECKYPRVRLPFCEHSVESAYGRRNGWRKVSGKYVAAFAAGMGVPYLGAVRVVNEALTHKGWPEVAVEEQPAGRLQSTTIVAHIVEDVKTVYPPLISRVFHALGVDPVAAIKAAAQEFVETPDGREYLRTNVGADCFNWGDAVVAVPPEILARHGVQALVVESLGPDVVVVNHDERIAGT
jgi:hypothetical protein